MGVEVERYSFFNLGARWGGWSTPRPSRFIPCKETRNPLYRMLGEPQGRSGQMREISHPTAIRSPDRAARSESLYRNYPGSQGRSKHTKNLGKFWQSKHDSRVCPKSTETSGGIARCRTSQKKTVRCVQTGPKITKVQGYS